MADLTCRRCGGTFHEAFFAGNKLAGYTHITKRAVCIGCEQTARDGVKRQDRFRVKARDALRRHADKYIKLGSATDRQDFAHRFGWDVDRMAHEAEHSYSNGCGYCGETFAEMGHGLADITLDVVNPKSPPYYGTNTKWACQTCNREKGKTPPEQWGAKLIAWAQWRKWKEKLANNGLLGLPLFDFTVPKS